MSTARELRVEAARPTPAQAPRHREVTASERSLHLLVLGLCLGLVGVALALEPIAPGGGERMAFAGVELPEACAFQRTLGLPCPGCGLTRSWVSALHLDLRASLAHHPLGWLVLLYATLQALRHGAWLAVPGRRREIGAGGRWLDRGMILLGALLVAFWFPALVRAVAG